MKHIQTYSIFESVEKKNWKLYAGLGGGFGGANYHKTFFGTEQEAEKEAYLLAEEEYEGMEGLHGLRTLEEIKEEDGLDDEDAEITYNEEKEGWLEYYVKEDDGIKESMNEKFFKFNKSIPRDPYMIKYSVINHKVLSATLNKPEERIGSTESEDYEYYVFDISKEKAEEKFRELWNNQISNFYPKPDLNIKSVENIRVRFKKEKGMENFFNKIHIY